jgi:hypothetical protein
MASAAFGTSSANKRSPTRVRGRGDTDNRSRNEAGPDRFAYRDAAFTPIGADAGEDDLVASTRVTDYARRCIANGARARASAAL